MKIEFRPATTDQADVLSDIAIESKGHWGYSREQLEIWREGLRITDEYIQANCVRSIYIDDKLIGFFAIVSKNKDSILDHLWLLSEAIGKGVGKAAFREIIKECKTLYIDDFIIISDPDAEGFYLKQGAKRIGEVESTPQKRMLPKLKYQLNSLKIR